MMLLMMMLTAQTARAAEYEISTLEELREFMEAVHVEDFAGDVIRLKADIDCEDGRFNTGDPEYPSTFRGTFDGQGHKIYNFVHGPTGSGQEGYGTAMFDFAETGAAIQNLTLEGSLPGDKYCGAYAAAFVLAVESPLGLLLDNCHFNGSVTNVYHSAALVGFASSGTGAGEVPSVTLINCSANANITTTRNYIAGGLVAKGTGVQAYNCSFKGKVTSLGTVGGLIGVAINCNLENCFEGGYTYIDENSNNVYSTYTLFTYTLFSGFSAYSYHIPHNINDTYGNEGYAKLVDGDKNTKWCVSYPYNTSNQWKPISVCFNYDFEFTPKGYILTTGNDVENHPDRMPKVWSLYGWDETGQAWDLLDYHDGQSNPLPGGNKEDRTYFLTDNGGTAKNYQKFMFKIEEIARENETWNGSYGGGWVTNEDDFVCELSELSFFGTADIHDLTNSTVSGIKPYYEYTDNTINLKYKVMDCSGNILTEDTHYTKAITRKNNNDGTWPDVSEVSESGEYIITFTGTAPYTGTKSVPFVVTDPALPSPLISSVENGNQIYYVKIPATGLMNLDLSASATPFTQPFYVYSDNGPGRDYSANSNGQLVITAPQDYVLQIEGDVRSEGYPNDYLVIYDGENNQTAVLGDNYFGSSGTQQLPLLNTTGRHLMLNFISNTAYNTEGVRLLVTPVSKSAANNITITTADNGEVTTSETQNVPITTEVVLNINPSNGYLLQSITATAGGKTVGIDGGLWYLNDPDSQDDERETATFVMPGADVTVTPTFAATNALSVYMPEYIDNSADALKVFIPNDVTSFKVYNAKDENGDYARNTVSYVQLVAPDDKILQISGTIDANGGAYLEAYDGTDKNNLLGRCDKDNTDIGMLVSSDYQALLFFASDDATPGQGIDITVRVLDPEVTYTIPTVTVAGGTITPNKPTAQVGGNVNLQIEPSNGYRLNALKVTQTIDGKDYEVPVTGGLWHDTNPTQASFVMPANDVAITPIFTNKSTAADDGLYINMPEFNYSYAPKTVNITSDITSFKVYDDGGKDGNCSPYCDSYMVLKAPAGMVLRLTGTVTVDESSAFLAVYDGDDTSHQIGTNYGNTTGENIGQLTSSGLSLMLRFHSGYPSNYAGLNLTVEVVPPVDITLTDNADNTSDIDDNKGTYANVTLSGRTLYKDGAWNTLCLPFAVTVGSDVMEGATAMTMNASESGFDASTGVLTLNFDNVTSGNTIAAGTPFIVKWTGTDLPNPVFYGVTIDNSDEALARKTVTSTDNLVQFRGIYSSTNIYSADHDNLFLGIGKNNQNEDVSMLYWPNTEGYTLGAFRAYFHVDLTETNGVRDIVLNFEDGTQTTGIIGHTDITDNTDKADAAWYTLDGRKLEGKPSSKGIYIHGGRKVVIK